MNQLLAVKKGVNAAAERTLTDTYHAAQRAGSFAGLSRTYQPKDEEGERLPGESTRVQNTVAGLLAAVREPLARMLDVELEKDTTNTVARADVVLGGEVIIEKAPVTYLLWLEKRLTDIKTLITKLPALDASESWTWDGQNDYYAAEPTQTQRAEKRPTVVVKYPATDKHPAQTEIFNQDVSVGTWNLRKFSGAVEPSRRAEALERVEAVLAAVRQAREAANSVNVVPVDKIGGSLLDYLFEPLTVH